MNYLELTIADLRAARNRADMLIAGLLEFQAGAEGISTGPTTVTAPAPPELTITVKYLDTAGTLRGHPAAIKFNAPQGTAKQGKPHKNTRKPKAVAEKLFKAVDRLPEPFTVDQVVKATKLDRKQCENFLVHRVADQVFERAGRGQYVRGKKFPTVTQPPPDRQSQTAATVPIKVRKLGERPGLVPMARGDAHPTTPKPAVLASVSSMMDKPTTLGAAMKMFIRTLTEFTGEQLRTALMADKDFSKLMEESYTTFSMNLTYWTKQGFLSKDGDGTLEALFTVTKSGKEWFAK